MKWEQGVHGLVIVFAAAGIRLAAIKLKSQR